MVPARKSEDLPTRDEQHAARDSGCVGLPSGKIALYEKQVPNQA